MPEAGTGARAVAALPMYDWPEVRAATDALWQHLAQALRDRGFNAPDHLNRGRAERDIWRDPDLLIAQTCGYPFVTELRDHVRLVATPIYDVDGCSGPLYCSQIIARADEDGQSLADMSGQRAAINNMASQSGFAALHAAVSALRPEAPFFAAAGLSGSHLKSMQAVAEGRADVAAIDAVCWALARRYHPDLAARLKAIAATAMTPALPFITARARPEHEVDQIAEALRACLADPGLADVRERLFLTSVERVAEADYLAAYAQVTENDFALLTPGGRIAAHPDDRSRAAQTPSR